MDRATSYGGNLIHRLEYRNNTRFSVKLEVIFIAACYQLTRRLKKLKTPCNLRRKNLPSLKEKTTHLMLKKIGCVEITFVTECLLFCLPWVFSPTGIKVVDVG
jgi:hypothetical protein